MTRNQLDYSVPGNAGSNTNIVTGSIQGFSLIEIMIAVIVSTLGLLAAGQLIYVAASSGSLSRSKGTAAVVAQNKLECLADLYHRNKSDIDLALGSHGPEQTQVINPATGAVLNRYHISWIVSDVSDPRPGKVLDARQIRVTVTPIHSGGVRNTQVSLNKVLNVTTVFSPMEP